MLIQNKDNQLALIDANDEILINSPTDEPINQSFQLKTLMHRLKTMFSFILFVSVLLSIISLSYIFVTQGIGSESYIYLPKLNLNDKKFVDISDVIILKTSNIPNDISIDYTPTPVEPDDTAFINTNVETPKAEIRESNNIQSTPVTTSESSQTTSSSSNSSSSLSPTSSSSSTSSSQTTSSSSNSSSSLSPTSSSQTISSSNLTTPPPLIIPSE